VLDFKHFIKKNIRPRGQRSFVASIPKENCTILDVGCGKNSLFLKSVKPNSSIYGVDVGFFEQSNESKALYEKLIICESKSFAQSIQNIDRDFDIIISNHNIEHCEDPQSTFSAMVDRTKVGGSIFFATPSLCSVDFPSRGGVLNFYDDPTHQQNPVDLMKLFKSESHRLEYNFYSESSKPIIWYLIGGAQEFVSRKIDRILLGTWDYYGFEQVMWIKKIGS
jgi:2-polyprenyl-3-methyl-5-hydroxy-6-metoxy-1,4-benzoquinol methylase